MNYGSFKNNLNYQLFIHKSYIVHIYKHLTLDNLPGLVCNKPLSTKQLIIIISIL